MPANLTLQVETMCWAFATGCQSLQRIAWSLGPVLGLQIAKRVLGFCLRSFACRTMLAVLVGLWIKCAVIMEQPCSSLMYQHPRAEHVCNRACIFQLNQFLGSYAHWSAKLCTFVSNRRLGCSVREAVGTSLARVCATNIFCDICVYVVSVACWS